MSTAWADRSSNFCTRLAYFLTVFANLAMRIPYPTKKWRFSQRFLPGRVALWPVGHVTFSPRNADM
ncbi:hypothetical protein COO20_02680 [Thalassospira marina]|uniref:Uncharacterized protein n=1 Tax=Thalassospira marina TaxID=2048283 RepID=A0A2N3KZX4_9PROT|nr:hypothetical protein COO20_02680 [Thalassospira marina]